MTQYWQPETDQNLIIKPSSLVFSFIIFLLIFASSCKNTDSDLGLNLRPDKGEIYSAETDTFTVNAFTVREDSIKTDSLSTNTLGAMHDPEFGISTSGVATQITISQVDITFGTAPKVDSVLLYMRWDKDYYYGNLNSAQSLNVYYINEVIEAGKKYFSNYKPALGVEIGKWTGNFNLKDSVNIKERSGNVKKAPGLLIKLYNKVGQDLANAAPSVYSSVDAFKLFMKGIVIAPEQNGLVSGQGAIAGIDFFTGNSQLIVYYNDTSRQSFAVNNNCKNFNFYNSNLTNQDIKNQLLNPGKHFNRTYVQSMGGCKTKIEIPYLLNLAKNLINERIIINEAALVFTPLNGSVTSNYTLPVRLHLFQPDSINQNLPILDYIDYLNPTLGPYSLYGGTYNSLTGEYTIRFTRHLQSVVDNFIINNKDNNKGFYLTIPSDKPITPTRLILDNTRLPNYKALKFRITYSKIKT